MTHGRHAVRSGARAAQTSAGAHRPTTTLLPQLARYSVKEPVSKKPASQTQAADEVAPALRVVAPWGQLLHASTSDALASATIVIAGVPSKSFSIPATGVNPKAICVNFS